MPVQKQVLLLLRDDLEREAITGLLTEMGAAVQAVASGQEAIHMIEESDCHTLIMDVQLADMHAWSLLGKIKELMNLSDLSTVVIMDTPEVAAVNGVTAVVRPVAMSRIKRLIQDLWRR